jgi:hypothetical protein
MALQGELVAHANLVDSSQTSLHSHSGGGGLSFTELAGGQDKAVSTASTWEDWDLSAIVPSGAVSVLVAWGASTQRYTVGARKNGSAASRTALTPDIAAASLNGWVVTVLTECDANRIIEIYSSNTGVLFNILGYWA